MSAVLNLRGCIPLRPRLSRRPRGPAAVTGLRRDLRAPRQVDVTVAPRSVGRPLPPRSGKRDCIGRPAPLERRPLGTIREPGPDPVATRLDRGGKRSRKVPGPLHRPGRSARGRCRELILSPSPPFLAWLPDALRELKGLTRSPSLKLLWPGTHRPCAARARFQGVRVNAIQSEGRCRSAGVGGGSGSPESAASGADGSVRRRPVLGGLNGHVGRVLLFRARDVSMLFELVQPAARLAADGDRLTVDAGIGAGGPVAQHGRDRAENPVRHGNDGAHPAGIVQAFNVNDIETAGWISRTQGTRAVPTPRVDSHRGITGWTRRPLLMPEEIMPMDPARMLILPQE